MRRYTCLLVLFFFLFSLIPSFAQTNEMGSSYFDMSEFPQWARDLRRGEIIAFGAFPFAYFFTNFGYDAYRWSNNAWDNRYAPWPFNSAGTVQKTQEEQLRTIGIAAGAAIVIAIVDYGIMRARRDRLERERLEAQIEAPIIIRTPLNEESE
ncbi:MAG: hypothetical protein FWG77_10195 [Treponema sp.]|nr:hypothetical protein [Treponema sp.]